jgi:hypothetical protein
MVPERLAGWLTTPLDLVEHEPITDFERAAALADLAGGLTGRMGSAPDTSDADAPLPRARFINTDTQLHLTRMPKGSWVGLEKILLADLDGIGNAAVRICDEQGPFGTALQSLLAR